MAKVTVQAIVNCPQYGLGQGETGEIDIDPVELEGRLSLGHLARVDSAKSKPAAQVPKSDTPAQ
jgi:hypothetical protein